MPNQNQEEPLTMAQRFDVAARWVWIYQRALVVPLRTGAGSDALGMSCLWAAFLILGWAFFSQDPLMVGYAIFWGLCLLIRRAEAAKLAKKGVRIHSWSDGRPKGLCKIMSEKFAKRWVEPLVIFAVGCICYWYAVEEGTPAGLAYFLMGAIFVLPCHEWICDMIWRKRVQAMVNARIDQEAMMNQYQQQWGE